MKNQNAIQLSQKFYDFIEDRNKEIEYKVIFFYLGNNLQKVKYSSRKIRIFEINEKRLVSN